MSEKQQSVLRKQCLRDLFSYCVGVLGYDDITESLHGKLCSFLAKPGDRKQVTLPRSYVKTWICSIAYPQWVTLPREQEDEFPYHKAWEDRFWQLGPNMRVLVASYVISNAEKMIGLIRKTYENNPALQILFPEVIPINFNKTRWSNESACISRSENFTESTFESAGIGGASISRHYDLIIEDDLVYAKKDDLSGKELQPGQEDMDKAIGWHKLSHSLLVPGKHTRIYNIGTRWAKHDLVDYIWTNEPSYDIFHRGCVDLKELEEKGDWRDCKPEWKEAYDTIQLQKIYDAQGSWMFCTPAEAPVLMGDWTSKPISQVRVGDEVIGFEMREGTRWLIKSKVRATSSTLAPLVKTTLGSGNIIRHTIEHKWFTGRGETDTNHPPYARAKLGSKLMFVMEPNVPVLQGENLELAHWLGGMFDGEGSCTNSIFLHQSIRENKDVCDKIEYSLNKLGFQWTFNYKEREDKRLSTKESYTSYYWLKGGIRERRRFMLQCNPVRANIINDSIFKHSSVFIERKDEVVLMEADEVEPVYALETETGNYIVYGYASSNSTQYLTIPISPEECLFKKEWLQLYTADNELPKTCRYFTTVDLSEWSTPTRKSDCDAVILTCGWDDKHNCWIVHYDKGRFDPSKVIKLMAMHWDKFHPEAIGIESVYYQKAIAHFAREYMFEGKVPMMSIRQLVPESGASKEIRIRAIEPLASNLGLHCKPTHKDLIYEFGDYVPNSRVCRKDLLDTLAYQFQIARPGAAVVSPERTSVSNELMTTTNMDTVLDKIWKKEKEKTVDVFNNPGVVDDPFTYDKYAIRQDDFYFQ
ncbi:hypothetical protein KKH13_04795 [Patescibacteria group bacterium]|nr:hypothetical protein [Patescibacteria group bacterium]